MLHLLRAGLGTRHFFALRQRQTRQYIYEKFYSLNVTNGVDKTFLATRRNASICWQENMVRVAATIVPSAQLWLSVNCAYYQGGGTGAATRGSPPGRAQPPGINIA